MGELAEPYQEDEELRLRNQELEQEDEELRRQLQQLESVQNRAVTATVIAEHSGAGDDDQNAASSPFGRKERRCAALALLLVVGVIVGLVIPLTTNNNRDSSSIDSAVTSSHSTTPTKAPTPTSAPTACTSMDCLTEILLQNEVADAEALQDESSPQFLALRWLATEDTAVLDLDSTSPVILVDRYILALLYFATSAAGWVDVLNFLSASSVCEWKNAFGNGVLCNVDGLVVDFDLCKSKPSFLFQMFALTHLFACHYI
jgi:hypothetical protein